MSRYRGFSQIINSKLKPRSISLQNLRSSVAISATKETPHFDDATLSAAKPFEEIPSLTILPFIGTSWVFLPIVGRYKAHQLNESLSDKRKMLGDIYREKFGNRNFVVTFSADDLKTMYEHEGTYPERSEIESLKAYREMRHDLFPNKGLLITHGKEWHDLRTKTQKHVMKPKAIQGFLNPMQDVARDLALKITKVKDSKNEVPNFLEELYKWALESVAIVGLDSRLGCLDVDLPPDADGMRMINSVQISFECMNRLEPFSGNLQLWKFFPTPTWNKFVKEADTFTEIAFKHINKSLEKLKNKANEDEELTLLQSMLMTKGMDVSSTLVMVSDMLMAGIDTTSHTVGFLLYHLAKNPEKQEILHQHLKSVLPQKDDRVTPAIFNELKYLKSCIKESQRLMPVAPGQVRCIDHDVVFSGYRVPAGTVLLVSIADIFKDEKYFSKPNEYLPERWMKKDENFHPFSFLPFSFGTRSCIGRRLAELEIICAITEIIRNFKVEYHYEDIGMFSRLVNTPDKPLKFSFLER